MFIQTTLVLRFKRTVFCGRKGSHLTKELRSHLRCTCRREDRKLCRGSLGRSAHISLPRHTGDVLGRTTGHNRHHLYRRPRRRGRQDTVSEHTGLQNKERLAYSRQNVCDMEHCYLRACVDNLHTGILYTQRIPDVCPPQGVMTCHRSPLQSNTLQNWVICSLNYRIWLGNNFCWHRASQHIHAYLPKR